MKTRAMNNHRTVKLLSLTIAVILLVPVAGTLARGATASADRDLNDPEFRHTGNDR